MPKGYIHFVDVGVVNQIASQLKIEKATLIARLHDIDKLLESLDEATAMTAHAVEAEKIQSPLREVKAGEQSEPHSAVDPPRLVDVPLGGSRGERDSV